MVASMTAFARQQQEFDWGTLSWEVRSVNHRYLEPGMRMHPALSDSGKWPERDAAQRRPGPPATRTGFTGR